MHASSDSGLLCSSSGASASGRLWIGQTVWPVGVVQDQVALAEGAALGVLAGQADRRALGQQRRERERLGVRPVDAGAGGRRRRARIAAALELFDELGVHGEPGRARAAAPRPARAAFGGTAVSTSGRAERSSWYSPVCARLDAAARRRRSSPSGAGAAASGRPTLLRLALDLLRVTTGGGSARSAHSSQTRFLVLIFAYISGWV
jgi:hypothetical protein